MNLANQALFIDIACLLWAFNFEIASDDFGQPIVPSRTDCVNEGLVTRPVTFPCEIMPRDANVAEVIAKAAA